MLFRSRCLLAMILASWLLVVHAKPDNIDTVIYLTLDGVRWQDMFLHHDRLPIFWEQHAASAEIYGQPGDKNTIEVASVPISQPSYSSQMTGMVTGCLNNSCARVSEETVLEQVKREAILDTSEIAVFSSWPTICLTAEHQVGSITTQCGSATQQTRLDAETISEAMQYYHSKHPRLLWISLDDADEMAHQGNWTGYLNALTQYDHLIHHLLETLDNEQQLAHTALIITTDHGRGNGIFWTSHGPLWPESKQTWAITFNANLVPTAIDNGITQYSTLSIKPTILQYFSS